MVNIIDENATQAITHYERITVENNVFDLFWDACNEVNKPNAALTSAA
jgi:uncharacterized protein (DUF1778 family)